MKRLMQIINSIHGLVTKALCLQHNKLMNKINKQMKHLIFVKEEWKREDLKKKKEKCNNNSKSKRNNERISIICQLVSSSQI